LHGVTSAWALNQVLDTLKTDEDKKLAILYMIIAIMAVYVACYTPAIKL